MADQVLIINRAYALLGSDRIVGPGDDSANTVAMLEQFDICRDIVIEAFPWDFSLEDAQLAAQVAAPLFKWTTKYILPSDPFCLKVWVAGETEPPAWEVKGRELFIDEAGPLNITYGARKEDPTLFSPGFVEAMATYLAWLFAIRVTRKEETRNAMWAYYLGQVALGRSSDGQQGPVQARFANDFLDHRR